MKLSASFVFTSFMGASFWIFVRFVSPSSSPLTKTSSNNRLRSLQVQQPMVGDRDRPLEAIELISQPIYGWYTSRPNKNVPQMDQVLMDEWTARWTEAGYEPKILDITHAQSHMNFENYSHTLLETNFSNTVYSNNRHHTLDCYYRYLAMAAQEMDTANSGSIMVDLDVFPSVHLEPFLVDTNNVTLYCNSDASTTNSYASYYGRPCAVAAASPQAWTAIAQRVLETSQEVLLTLASDTPRDWSDMHSLLYLQGKEDQNIQFISTSSFITSLKSRPWDSCAFRLV